MSLKIYLIWTRYHGQMRHIYYGQSSLVHSHIVWPEEYILTSILSKFKWYILLINSLYGKIQNTENIYLHIMTKLQNILCTTRSLAAITTLWWLLCRDEVEIPYYSEYSSLMLSNATAMVDRQFPAKQFRINVFLASFYARLLMNGNGLLLYQVRPNVCSATWRWSFML